jgi:hypothetical protein
MQAKCPSGDGERADWNEELRLTIGDAVAVWIAGIITDK